MFAPANLPPPPFLPRLLSLFTFHPALTYDSPACSPSRAARALFARSPCLRRLTSSFSLSSLSSSSSSSSSPSLLLLPRRLLRSLCRSCCCCRCRRRRRRRWRFRRCTYVRYLLIRRSSTAKNFLRRINCSFSLFFFCPVLSAPRRRPVKPLLPFSPRLKTFAIDERPPS